MSQASSASKKSSTAGATGRYRSYAKTSSGARRVNYITKHASPAMMCLLRKAQPSPYVPLPTEVIQQAAQPLDYSLRPPPHVSHQAVMDFYAAINGHCGVHCESPRALELITLGAHAHGGRGLAYRKQLHQEQLAQHQRGPTDATGAPLHNQQQPYPPVTTMAAVDKSKFAKEVEDYRLTQFRRNAQHVDSSVFGRVCNFYNTREGCRRGATCEFVHMDRQGRVVNAKAPRMGVEGGVTHPSAP